MQFLPSLIIATRGLVPCTLAFAALTLTAPTAHAGKVATWRQDTAEAFEKGKRTSVVIGPTGTIELTREMTERADLECGLVWDLARGADDRLVAATAMPGQVVALGDDGTTKVLWKSESLQAFSLVCREDGSILVGTGPEGTIYRVAADGTTETFFHADALYVWDLAVDRDGNLFAATGPGGRIYKLDADGHGEVFCETRQPHVLALAVAPNGELIAGTDGAGLVLSIDAEGTSRVLYDTAENEVRALWIDESGTIFAGTATDGSTSNDSGSSRSSTRSTSSGDRDAKAAPNSVYRIDPAGGVRKVFGAEALVYALGHVGAPDTGHLLAGTGNQGIVFAVEPIGDAKREFTRFDAESVLSMLPLGERALIGTGNPGKVYAIEASHAAEGTLVSEPLDAKLLAEFGAISWRADVPRGTQVAVAVRSGNTEQPDDSWSGWSVDATESPAAADCPVGRFLQYRLTLRTTEPKATPAFHSFSARYLTANQAPQLTKLTVPHVEERDGKQLVDEYKLEWSATDANNDDLEYQVSFRKPEWRHWVTLKENVTATNYEWDVTSVPEGVYEVCVVASDARSNPPETALDARLISEQFVVDRGRPDVTAKLLRVEGADLCTFEASAKDSSTPIVAAAYSIDSRDWVNLFPDDRLFDATAESFRFDIEGLARGTHVLVIRATDAAGHTGSTDVVFEVGGPQAVDNVSSAQEP